MIIPIYVDINKDKELIKWLSEQTNRSAFIRYVLYEKMNGYTSRTEKVERIENEIFDSIENL
jgi:hypothetical protein